MNGSGWYNAGDAATLTVPSQTVGGADGTRLVFNGWSVDGNNQAGSRIESADECSSHCYCTV